MHEHSLINNLLKKIHQIAVEQAPSEISVINVRLGALSHISAEHFREHFEHAVAGTALASVGLTVMCDDDIHAATAQDIMLTSIDFTEAG